MSKIDDYRIAKARAERFRRTLEAVSQSNCDKFGARVSIKETYIGYYGDSSAHAWSDELTAAVVAEIEKQLRGFIRAAVNTAEAAAERARKDAETEAREVLQEAATK